jgi:ParB family chromosome partitioning protein
MSKRGGLGRGLAALIPTSAPEDEQGPLPVADDAADQGADPEAAPAAPPAPPVHLLPPAAQAAATVAAQAEAAVGVPGAQLREVAVVDVVPNPRQPRQVFDDEALEELTYSVREFGLLQPIVVRERPEGGYELIMGERRLRAARAADLKFVPAIIRDTTDDALLRDALLENIHRVQLNPLEEAAAYQQLLEEFGATHEELASRIGRSRSQVTNTIRLLKLPVKVQTRVAAGSSPPATPGRCSACPTPRSRRRWPRASSPRGCRCGPRRRRSRWPSPRSPRPSGGRGSPPRQEWRTSPAGSRTPSRPR